MKSIALIFMSLLAQNALADAPLGSATFPVTASPAVRAHFDRGLLALHSFWYDEAIDEFQAATKADPDFAMGYWGEAMALNHPLWGQQATAQAKTVLSKISPDAKITAREKMFIDNLRILYGSGDKPARDKAYSAAMDRAHEKYPADDEVALFDALALIGAAHPGLPGNAMRMRAGAIALEIFARNPNHPGAAHYIIHAFDDPDHAILALPAARRYAQIAPEAFHARHMPSHIFVQLGMWPEAQAACESAWLASKKYAARKWPNDPTRGDYHSLSWLVSIYLQRGMTAKAEEKLLVTRDALAAQKLPQLAAVYGQELIAFMTETGQWSRLEEFMPSLEKHLPSEVTKAPAAADCGHKSEQPPYELYLDATISYLRGFDAALKGRDAGKQIARLREIAKKLGNYEEGQDARIMEMQALQISARAAHARGKLDVAKAEMQKAIALEDSILDPGPHFLPPAHELLADILAAANRPQEAAEEYRAALVHAPNRTRALAGLARVQASR